MSKKPRLGEEVRRLLHEKGISVPEAAKMLNLSANSLRAWTYRNDLPRDVVVGLAQLVGITGEIAEIQEQYDFGLTRPKGPLRGDYEARSETPQLSDALRAMDRRLEKAKNSLSEFAVDPKTLFRSLGSLDMLVHYSTDQEPFEFSHEGMSAIGLEVVRAVRAGAKLVYIYPAEAVVRVARRADLRRVIDPEEFESIHHRFIRFLATIEKDSESDIGSLLKKQIRIVPCNLAGYLLPGCRLILLCAHSGNEATYRAVVSVPIGTAESEMHAYLPLDRTATDRLIGFVKAVLAEASEAELAREI